MFCEDRCDFCASKLLLGVRTIGLMSFHRICCLFSAQQVNELMQKIHKLTDN